MINFNPCARPCFIPWNLTIPTAFSESYSYAEMVCYLFKLIKNLEEKFNTNNETILDYVDEQINNLKDYTEHLVSNLRDEEKADIENLSNTFNEYLNNLKNYVDNQDKLVYNNAINYFNTLVDDQPPYLVRNPVTAMPDTLQNTLNDLYETIRWFALTAAEYDSCELTAEEYDKKGVMAKVYDLYAKCVFWYNLYTVFSEFTGEKVSHQQALNEITQHLRVDGISANAYDEKQLTSTDYDTKEIEAYNYDWSASTILV